MKKITELTAGDRYHHIDKYGDSSVEEVERVIRDNGRVIIWTTSGRNGWDVSATDNEAVSLA